MNVHRTKVVVNTAFAVMAIVESVSSRVVNLGSSVVKVGSPNQEFFI